MPPTNDRPSPLEIVIGRSLALILHPYAAWRSPFRRDRVVLVSSYFLASYAIVLGALSLLVN